MTRVNIRAKEAYSLNQPKILKQKQTLNREPIEENFDDFEDSSGKGGNKPDTKEHSEVLKSAWCSAIT